MSGSIVVRPAATEEVLELRMAVLRPGFPVVAADYDAFPGTRHVAAIADDVVVGCATVFPSPYRDADDAWQLRGMAVAPDRQGEHIGAVVLEGAIELAQAAGAPLVWANARTTALGFYERLGFEPVGDVFTYGALDLPHKVIVRALQKG